MGQSIALATGIAFGLGYAAACLLATMDNRGIAITGRSLAPVREMATQLAAETRRQVFTPLELDLGAPSRVQSALSEFVNQGRPIDFLPLKAGMAPGKKRMLTAAGIEASRAQSMGHYQLMIELLYSASN